MKIRSIFSKIGMAIVGCAMLFLSGCSDPPALENTWVDDSGYIVEFTSDGRMSESIYGMAMPYVYENGSVLYYLPDGIARQTKVDFNRHGELVMKINGDERVFHTTSGSVCQYKWDKEEVDPSTLLRGKYILKSDVGVKSELRLLEDQEYALTYKAGDKTLADWNKKGNGVRFGLYANGGVGESLYLYYDNGELCEAFKQSPDGKYAATYLLDGVLSKIQEDYSSKITTRGYTVAGTVQDPSVNVSYRFGDNKTVTKTSSKGVVLNYSYFINEQGLLSMSCTDAVLPVDFMWVDIETGQVYRIVYERDSWTDYMYSTTMLRKPATQLEQSTPASQEGLDGSGGDMASGDQGDGIVVDSKLATGKDSFDPATLPAVSEILTVIDADLVVNVAAQGDAFIPARFTQFESDAAQLFSTQEGKTLVANWVDVQEQVEKIQYDIETRRALEDAMLFEHEEFLRQMAIIAEERRLAEEEQKRLEEEEQQRQEEQGPEPSHSQYVFQPPEVFNTQSPAPGAGTSGGVNRPTLPAGNFGNGSVTSTPLPTASLVPTSDWAPPVYSGNYGQSYGRFTLNWHCNCSSCRTSTTLVPPEETLVALVDPYIIVPGSKVVLGGQYNTQVRTKDSGGTVTGYVIDVYVTDHVWANNARSSLVEVYPCT